jgi:alanine-glyoxylate transaminase/serine-glyoxylate transaminase/serine-pyruvate transaminase
MLLAGGGPSSPDPRVLAAMALPVIGQFDPCFTDIMDEVKQLARQTFVTQSEWCFVVSAPRSAGLQAVLNSLPDGTPLQVVRAGAGPDLRARADECHARGELVVVDASAVLGGQELRVDAWGIDVCIAGTDACLGGPAGLCLVTYSDRVQEHMRARTAPPRSNYLDLLQLQAYWSPERLNHHTAPTSLIYGLREGLRVVLEEGLESRWKRHQCVADALAAGFDALQLKYRAEPPTFVVEVEAGAFDVCRRLREEFDVHVRQAGERALRIGLTGADAQRPAAARLLSAMGDVLA